MSRNERLREKDTGEDRVKEPGAGEETGAAGLGDSVGQLKEVWTSTKKSKSKLGDLRLTYT